MNIFNLESQGANTYLVYKMKENDEQDTISLGMLSNNKIAGITPVIYTQIDHNNYFKYNITSKISANQFFSGLMNKKKLLGLFSGIVNAIISAEEYMVDMNTLIFDLEYIFVDASTCKAEMLCLPLVKEEEIDLDLVLFFKNILFSIQFDPMESSEYITKIMNYLNSVNTLDVAEFKVLIDSLENESGSRQTYQKQENKSMENSSGYKVNLDKKALQQPSDKHQSVHRENSIQNKSIPKKEKQINEQVDLKNMPEQKEQEKDISLFYLLQHYNKDNAAMYKVQKENKKGKKEVRNKTEKPSKKNKKMANQSFSVPNQESNMAVPERKETFAIPGQKESFAIPGKMEGFSIPGQSSEVSVPSQNVSDIQSTNDTTPSVQQPKPTFIPPSMGREDGDFGETVVMGEDMEFSDEATVMLDCVEDIDVVPYIVRCKTNEKIMIDKPLIKIGRSQNHVDYCIHDNRAIGRNHADIITRNGEYFIVDMKSVNHTYVDDKIIASGVETKLTHDTKIRMADEDFEFRMF